MSNQHDENLTEIFKALSHPLRQDIIHILAERHQIGGMGFTALQNELNRGSSRKKPVQVGTIYHHIGLLGNLLHQSEGSKSWTLSERGLFAFNLLTSSQDRNQFLSQGDLQQRSRFVFVVDILAPPSIFFYIKRSITLFIGWQILFFLIFAVHAVSCLDKVVGGVLTQLSSSSNAPSVQKPVSPCFDEKGVPSVRDTVTIGHLPIFRMTHSSIVLGSGSFGLFASPNKLEVSIGGGRFIADILSRLYSL